MKNEEMNVGEEKSGFFKKYFACLKLDTKSIARNAIVAALYAVLTYAFFFISYGNLQVRISEFMVLLCFFNPNYIYGLTLGCIVANIYSPAMSAFCSPLDIVIGTLATFLSCVCISLSRRMLIASFFPAIFNGLLDLRLCDLHDHGKKAEKFPNTCRCEVQSAIEVVKI